jgi:hypothetical protein
MVNLQGANPASSHVFISPQAPPQMSAVSLNEVFAQIYRFNAYDSVAFLVVYSQFCKMLFWGNFLYLQQRLC